MTNEDYVSPGIAKLLIEKGFDWVESPFYSEQDRDEWRQNNSYTVHNEEYNPELPFDSETLTMVAPHVSPQKAMKWLREVHNITIGITFSLDIITYEIQKDKKVIIAVGSSRSYEVMVEDAIKYCLENLI